MLKTCWDNIKRNTRKDTASTKKELFLTGGGRPNPPSTGPFQGQVEAILGPTLDGLNNVYDSDAQFTADQIVIVTDETDANVSIDDNTEVIYSINETAVPSVASSSQDECTLLTENKENLWNGWSPAALKTKVSEKLTITKKSPAKKSLSIIQRRRPKTSLHDKLLESKLELVEMAKKNAETEAELKFKILQEQLKQEKMKTELLQLQLDNLKK